MPSLPDRRVLLSSIATIMLLANARGSMAADPKDTADQIFSIYVDTLVQTNTLLEGTPPAEDVADKMAAIKEASVTKLVALGHEVAAMSEADRTAVEASLNSSISSMTYKPETKKVYEGYQAVWGAYVKGDKELFQTIKSLNILTQYAFFDLLRKQEPAEADRLGV